MLDGDLDIPESNREIALHLRAINNRLTSLESAFTELHTAMESRRFKLQDIFISSLMLPVLGGTLLFLLTKALG